MKWEWILPPGMYNFHSHPREAYETANVKFGWPSAQDYVGFLMAFLEDGTVMHLVTTIEGMYIMSMSEYCLENKGNLPYRVSYVYPRKL